MNSWNQPQQQNNMTMGQAQFNPYNNYGWNMPQRAPVYRADPIHGENAAWAFPIGGGEIWLPDADRDIVWWIRIDQNGNKQVKAFDVLPHEEKPPVDTNDLAARLAAVEEWINGKQNKSNARRNGDLVATVSTTTPTAT